MKGNETVVLNVFVQENLGLDDLLAVSNFKGTKSCNLTNDVLMNKAKETLLVLAFLGLLECRVWSKH
jgi:hypothetical protein